MLLKKTVQQQRNTLSTAPPNSLKSGHSTAPKKMVKHKENEKLKKREVRVREIKAMRKEHKLDKHWERCKQTHNFEENLRKVWEGSPKEKMERRSRDWKIQKKEQGRWKEAKKESKDTSHRMKEQTCKNVSLRLDLSFRLRFLCARNSSVSSPQLFGNFQSQNSI